jgi:hypothetical protein
VQYTRKRAGGLFGSRPQTSYIYMQYSYKIIYDIKKDMWNWRGALSDFRMGYNWIDNIDNGEDRKIADQIVGLKKQPAELILKPYLKTKKDNQNSKLNKFIRIAKKEFQDKFTDACTALERITKRPMMSSEFTFYVTTFPRMTCFYDKHVIYMYDSTEDVWGMPIDGFLHEGLHFQFEHYWRNDKSSPVFKVSDDDYFYLKEALTVILDDELKPIITVPDESYPELAKLREPLHKHWKKNHDFDKLVDYGLSILGKLIR